jgi:hypothetical protein
VHNKEVGGYQHPSIEFPFPFTANTAYYCKTIMINPAGDYAYRLSLRESFRPSYPYAYYQSSTESITTTGAAEGAGGMGVTCSLAASVPKDASKT